MRPASGSAQARTPGTFLMEIVTRMLEHLRPHNASEGSFADTIAKIESMEHLKPGWNGFRGDVPPPDVRRTAIDFLRDVPNRFPGHVDEPTVVAPTPDGGVMLEWHLVHYPRSLELVFMPSGLHEWSFREAERTLELADDASLDQLYDVMKQHVVGRTIAHLH